MSAAGPCAVLSVAEQRARFRQGKDALLTHFQEARPSATSARLLLHGLARHVDATLVQLWQTSGLPAGAALLAVGGYGRGELYPYSDVDVLVLLPEPETDAVRETVSAFITACM